jgi:hypothetical protein
VEAVNDDIFEKNIKDPDSNGDRVAEVAEYLKTQWAAAKPSRKFNISHEDMLIYLARMK